jgi:hypothetical protein
VEGLRKISECQEGKAARGGGGAAVSRFAVRRFCGCKQGIVAEEEAVLRPPTVRTFRPKTFQLSSQNEV